MKAIFRPTPRTSWTLDVHERTAVGKGHDRWHAGPGFLAVADGATPLLPSWPDPGLFAERALSALHNEVVRARRRHHVDIRAIIAEAVRRTVPTSEGSPWTASCAVALAVWHADDLILAALGDCTVRATPAIGGAVTVTDPAIARLDRAVGRLDTESERSERRMAVRRSMNRPDSYWVFANDPAAGHHAHTAHLNTASVRQVELWSDGFRCGARDTHDDDATYMRASAE